MGNSVCLCEDSNSQETGGSTQGQQKVFQRLSQADKDDFNFNAEISNSTQIYEMKESKNKKVSLQDFKMVRVLGRGSFGKVVLVVHKETNQLFAIKVLSKEMVEKKNQKMHTQSERKILECLNKEPFVVEMHYAFQTPLRLYFVLEFCQGGELFFHLRKSQSFSEIRTKFYAAQIVLALEAIHK